MPVKVFQTLTLPCVAVCCCSVPALASTLPPAEIRSFFLASVPGESASGGTDFTTVEVGTPPAVPDPNGIISFGATLGNDNGEAGINVATRTTQVTAIDIDGGVTRTNTISSPSARADSWLTWSVELVDLLSGQLPAGEIEIDILSTYTVGFTAPNSAFDGSPLPGEGQMTGTVRLNLFSRTFFGEIFDETFGSDAGCAAEFGDCIVAGNAGDIVTTRVTAAAGDIFAFDMFGELDIAFPGTEQIFAGRVFVDPVLSVVDPNLRDRFAFAFSPNLVTPNGMSVVPLPASGYLLASIPPLALLLRRRSGADVGSDGP